MIEVIMIEDDVELAEILSEFLKSNNVNLTNYPDPIVGMRAIEKQKYDLLLKKTNAFGKDIFFLFWLSNIKY